MKILIILVLSITLLSCDDAFRTEAPKQDTTVVTITIPKAIAPVEPVAVSPVAPVVEPEEIDETDTGETYVYKYKETVPPYIEGVLLRKKNTIYHKGQYIRSHQNDILLITSERKLLLDNKINE
jgi:hypothetical protein